MFTGLVEARGAILEVRDLGSGRSIRVAAPTGWDLHGGSSVCVSGACLTISDQGRGWIGFDLSEETLKRTWFSALRQGHELNLERALRFSDRLEGHLVSGHVDACGRCTAVRDPKDGGRLVTFEAGPGLERYLVDKGSIAVDGVSLTVVAPRGRSFDVALIPLTLEKTTLGRIGPGTAVNLEADQIGKWVDRLLPRETGSGGRP